MKQRLIILSRNTLILLGIGVLYAVFYSISGVGIPCVFKLITGLSCPGCGVSRMCMSIIHLDFRSAFRYNMAVFCLLPFFIVTAGRLIYVYIKYGSKKDKYADVAIWIMIGILVIFGIVRNIIHV